MQYMAEALNATATVAQLFQGASGRCCAVVHVQDSCVEDVSYLEMRVAGAPPLVPPPPCAPPLRSATTVHMAGRCHPRSSRAGLFVAGACAVGSRPAAVPWLSPARSLGIRCGHPPVPRAARCHVHSISSGRGRLTSAGTRVGRMDRMWTFRVHGLHTRSHISTPATAARLPGFPMLRMHAVGGSVGCGKSSLVAVLCHGGGGRPALDDGRGRARTSVLRHRHEIQSGHTSSISQCTLGYDGSGTVLNYSSVAAPTAAELSTDAHKLLHFIDLCGHSRFFKTALYGAPPRPQHAQHAQHTTRRTTCPPDTPTWTSIWQPVGNGPRPTLSQL